MIENRLCLNKKPIYELPDDVLLGFYNKLNTKPSIIPNFKPDICFNNWGSLGAGLPKETSRQYWVKTDNQDLIEFIRAYNWNNCVYSIGSPFIPKWLFKKIILEEFYNKQ